jgi:four helix bundle protein
VGKDTPLKLNEEQLKANSAGQRGSWTSGQLNVKAAGHLGGETSFRENLIGKADELAHLVYPLTYKFPQEEKYALGDQIRRAVVSVPTNLIERIARGGEKEKRQFANIAYGSLKETRYLCYFSYKEGLIKESDYQIILPKFEELSKLLFSFLKILKR